MEEVVLVKWLRDYFFEFLIQDLYSSLHVFIYVGDELKFGKGLLLSRA